VIRDDVLRDLRRRCTLDSSLIGLESSVVVRLVLEERNGRVCGESIVPRGFKWRPLGSDTGRSPTTGHEAATCTGFHAWHASTIRVLGTPVTGDRGSEAVVEPLVRGLQAG
jgi:hypothetical protein